MCVREKERESRCVCVCVCVPAAEPGGPEGGDEDGRY